MPDLYRSLRGAGASNFGIVTSFTLEAFPQPNTAGLWGGTKSFSWDKVPDLLKLNYKFTTESMDLDPEAAIINIFGYLQPYDAWWGIYSYRHTTHANPLTWPQAFQPYERLEGLPETTNIGIQPLSNITLEMAQSSPVGDRNIYGTFTYRPSIALEQKLIDLFREEANSVKNIPEFLPAAFQQPVSRNVVKKMRKRGGNALGIADSGEKGPLTVFTVSWKWKHASDDESSYAAYYSFIKKAEAMAKEMGAWHPYKYINYAEATQDVWAGHGERTVKELRRMQRKVDPDGVFAKGGLGGGYFKLNGMPTGRTLDVSSELADGQKCGLQGVPVTRCSCKPPSPFSLLLSDSLRSD
jgi:FAD/FMN-containing dehydrogenase